MCRRIQLNKCLARDALAMLQWYQMDKWSICSARLCHLSAQIATLHINECMDQFQKRIAGEPTSSST
jgi:hypothetical protein